MQTLYRGVHVTGISEIKQTSTMTLEAETAWAENLIHTAEEKTKISQLNSNIFKANMV